MPDPFEELTAKRFSFGKHKGKKIADVARSDPGYVIWFDANVEKVEPVDLRIAHEEFRTRPIDDDGDYWCDATEADIY